MDKFAVIKTGGKQYIAHKNEKLRIEKLTGDYKVGDKVVFDKILMVDDGENTQIGAPILDGAEVEAEITKIARAKKIDVIKYKAKSRYFKKQGHKQPYFEVKVTAIK
jgi:large subunit ribosomal protein L21